MSFLNGQFNSTLDEKGRISLPSRLREELSENVLMITKGMMVEDCLWVYSPEEWERTAGYLMNSSNPFSKKLSLLKHQFLAPAQKTEIDKIGRIAVPQTLRDHAGLSRDCIIMGVGDHIEIWDTGRYRAFYEANRSNLGEILEEMSAETPLSGG